MTNLKSQISNLKSLLVILLIFTALTLYQSIVLPLGEADDETDHYQYLRFVAQTGHPPFTEAERNEAGFKGGLAPLYYWLTAWPVALIGEDTLPDIRRIDARPERHIPTDGLGINHVLHTLDEQWPWRGQVLAWHLVRLLSLPMAWITIIATYVLVHRLWPEPKMVALGAAAFIAFLPRFVSSSAVINDDNLVFALITLLLLTQVIILQNTYPSPRIFAIFGALFGLALITKYLAIILFPEVIFTLFVYQVASRKVAGSRVADRQSPQDRQPPMKCPLGAADRQSTPPSVPNTTDYASERSLPLALGAPFRGVGRFRAQPPLGTLYASPSSLLSFLAALILTAGPWFAFITLRFNRINELGLIPGLAAALGEPQVTEGLVGLLSGQSVRPVAATYNLPEWLGLLYRSFWFEYGWMHLFAPMWVYALFTVFLLLAAMGHVLRVAYYVRRKTQHAIVRSLPLGRNTFYFSPIFWLLGLHLLLFVIVVLARYVLSATIDTGQGRHLYPALAVIALLVSLGLTQLGFRIFPVLATDLLPAMLRLLPTPLHPLLLTSYFLLPALLYLLPAALCLHPSFFILPNYSTVPVTITPSADLPITYRHTLPFADGLSLAGFDVATTVSAGEALPVTLYWRADREAEQDYLVSLCLRNSNDNLAVACWAGQFVDGRYPARAWEAGDTLADIVFIPIPTCYRILDQTYYLHLEVWPLAPDSPEPAPGGPLVLQQTFAEPLISIRATDSLLTNLPQTLEVWRGNQRLTSPTSITLAESLTWLDYTDLSQTQAPGFIRQATGASTQWSPLVELNTSLFLPCDDGPAPFAQLAHFIAGPALPPGPYLPSDTHALPDLTLSLNLRHRTFAPISSTLTFTPYLAPLSLEFPGQPPMNFLEEWKAKSLEKNPNLPIFQPSNLPSLHPSNPFLPITIRWQARRWMADPLIISLKLLDKDFKVGGERLATLGDRYPNVLWAPTEIIEETYPLRLNADAPPGLYRLEMSLLRQDKNLPDGYEYLPLTSGETPLGNNLYPATFRLLDPADGTPPPQPFSAQLGNAIHLIGYDLNPQSPRPSDGQSNLQSPISNLQYPKGTMSPISLALYWQSTAKIPMDYTVFTQLLGPDGQVWAQWDNPPQAGRYPTTAWAEHDTVVDRYTLTLREGAPSGQYRLLVGMYNPATRQRLPATINGQPQPDNAVELTTLTINY